MPSKIRRKIRIDYPDGSFEYKFVNVNSLKELGIKEKKVRSKALQKFERLHTPTFEQVADEWNSEHSKEVEFYTFQGYQAPLKELKEAFSGLLINQVKPLDLQRLLVKLEQEGKARQTIKLIKIVCNQIFDYAVLKGYIEHNSISSVKLSRKAPKKVIEATTQADIEVIKQSVDLPFGLFPYFCLYTGCRRGEALAVTYEDIDFKNNLISINKVVVFEGNRGVIHSRTKSEAGVRTIPLLTPLKNVLPRGQGLVFDNEGKPYNKSMFDKRWATYRELTGVKTNLHQLRHSFATICYDAGIEPKQASIILGHSRIGITMDTYTHIRESRANEVANKLNEYLLNFD